MSEVSNPTPPTQTKMAQFDPAHHAQTDPWIPEGQADDRTPMDVLSETATKILVGNGVCPATPSIDVQEVVASETRLTRLNCLLK
jgi:hypothetical protein